jgi:hypothetical protein
VDGVWNLETLHTVGVPPLLEVHLERPPTPITVVSTYFTFVFNTQPVQLVQPIWNWLTVPSQR